MSMAHFAFETRGFVDPPEILAQNVNGIAGHALATWLSGELRREGIDASSVWAEDHGWDFSVAQDGARYVCACCVIVDDDPPHEGHVTLGKSRSMMDRLTGRGAQTPDDPVAGKIAAILAGSADIAAIVREG